MNVPVSQLYTFKNFTDLTEQDTDEVLHGRNDPEVRRWMTSDRVISAEEHNSFVKRLKCSSTQLYLRVDINEHFLGVYSLNEINGSTGLGGFWSSKYARSKFLGLNLVFRSIEFLFKTNSLEGIHGYQLKSNSTAVKLNRILGFDELSPDDGADDRMTYLILSRDKWSQISAKNSKVLRLVELAERTV